MPCKAGTDISGIDKEFSNGEERPSEKENTENYCDGKFTSHGGVCSTGGLFFCAFDDPDLSASPDHGAVYPGDDERRAAGCAAGISVYSDAADPFDRDTGLHAVRGRYPAYDHRCALVGRERRSVGHVRTQLHLCKHRDEKLYLSEAESFPVYGDLPSGDHALARSVGIRKQYQRNAV